MQRKYVSESEQSVEKSHEIEISKVGTSYSIGNRKKAGCISLETEEISAEGKGKVIPGGWRSMS